MHFNELCSMGRLRQPLPALIAASFAALLPAAAFGDDWPTWRHDNARSGMTKQTLTLPLQQRWVHKGRHAPRPAWPPPAKHDFWHNKTNLPPRVTFDRAYHVVAAGGRVFFGTSADDKVICLDAKTGKTKWTFFAEGPVRLAPAIADGKVYFGSDDGHAYCLNAEDGSLIWKHNAAGTNRRIPGNGRMISVHPVRSGIMIVDGTAHLTAGLFPNQGVFRIALDAATGKPISREPIKISPQGYLQLLGDTIHVPTGRTGAKPLTKLQRRGETAAALGRPPAKYPYALIAAGEVRIAGGEGEVAAFVPGKNEPVWTTPVEGRAYSLAVANGCLLVSTDCGRIYCFSPAKEKPPAAPIAAQPPATLAYPDATTRKRYASLAERILVEAKITKGYCLVLNAEQGRLVGEIARRTQLHVIGLEDDADNVETARRALDQAGLYGRAVIHHGPLDPLPYGDRLFNLVTADGVPPDNSDEVARVLVPESGTACFARGEPIAWDVSRGKPLEGAGRWTHAYANPANTTCSGDRYASDHLALQWFGRPGPQNMVDRHHRTFPPLCIKGRLFIPGNNHVFGVDAYNGTVLWEREVPDFRRIGGPGDTGHMAAAEDILYVLSANRCLGLHADTGKDAAAFEVPPAADGTKRHWGYLAVAGDSLLGTATMAGASRTGHSRQAISGTYYDFRPAVTSRSLFCLDRQKGSLRWKYDPTKGAIVNTTITLGGGRIYFVESTNADTLKTPDGRSKLSDLFGKGANVVAINAAAGTVAWRKPIDLSALQHRVYGCYAEETFVVTGSRNQDRRAWYDLHAVDAKTGDALWRQSMTAGRGAGGSHGEQDQHPVIVGETIYLEPFAWKLATGEPVKSWQLKRGGGCGLVSASASTFYFRARNPTACSLATGKQQKITTVSRPGCWINIIPAAGLVLIPEASSGCTCPFSVQSSMAFAPAQD